MESSRSDNFYCENNEVNSKPNGSNSVAERQEGTFFFVLSLYVFAPFSVIVQFIALSLEGKRDHGPGKLDQSKKCLLTWSPSHRLVHQ